MSFTSAGSSIGGADSCLTAGAVSVTSDCTAVLSPKPDVSAVGSVGCTKPVSV